MNIGNTQPTVSSAIIKIFSDEKVQKLSIPVLFISGKDDELVPPGMMHKLYRIVLSKGTCSALQLKPVNIADSLLLNQT